MNNHKSGKEKNEKKVATYLQRLLRGNLPEGVIVITYPTKEKK